MNVMKTFFRVLLSLPVAGMFFSGCQKSLDTRIDSEPETDALKGKIIYQFSFDADNNYSPSFKGWTSPSYSFSKDVPPGGGLWSLQLTPGWIPQQGYAEHAVILDTGTYQLKFGCYTKVLSNSTIGVGYLRLIKRSISSTNTTTSKTLAEKSFTNQTWKTHSVTASAHIGAGDVIIIQVSAGTSELVAWQTLFDEVVLAKQ
jgi:hypothetical protein